MVHIESRASWGASRADGDLSLGSSVAHEVFLHHTAMSTLPASATVEQERQYMRSLERVGQSRFGNGISYNVIVFQSGRAYQGVSWNRRGTHTGGRNSTARSICFAGNFDVDEPTPAALATAAAIFAMGRGSLWRATAPLRLHRDVKGTACPGRNVVKHQAAIAGGATLVGNPVSAPAVAPDRNADGSLRIAVDGSRGPGTIGRWQEVMGTSIDFSISKPVSSLIKADQAFLNRVIESGHIKNLTGKPALDVDGDEGPRTVKVRQFWLYNTQGPGLLGRAPRVSDFDGNAGPETTRLHQHALNLATARSGRY